MPRTSTNWSVNDQITAARLQTIDADLDDLYSYGSDRLRVRTAVSGTALKIDISAGAARVGTTPLQYAGATDISMTDNATNYVQIDAAGTIQLSTSAWTATYARLATVTTSGGAITAISIWKSDAVGGVLGGIDPLITAKTADYTITVADDGKYFNNIGSTYPILFTMPNNSGAGNLYGFTPQALDEIYISPNAINVYEQDSTPAYTETLCFGGSGNLLELTALSAAIYLVTRKIGTFAFCRGYFVAGRTTTPVTTIDKVKGVLDTVAAITAVTSTTLYGRAGVATMAKGYALGGVDSGDNQQASIEKFTYSTEASAANSASLATGRGYNNGGTCAHTKGYMHGGYIAGGNSNKISGFTWATEVDANLTATLTTINERNVCMETLTKGYSMTGSGNATGVDGLTFSTEANAAIVVTITSQTGSARVQSLTNFYVGGGGAPTNAISKYVPATDTPSTLAATLQTARNESPGGVSLTAGYIGGGESGATKYDKVDKFTWATEACAANSQNLSSARGRVCGHHPTAR